MAFKPTWARLHGLFGDRDASPMRKAAGSGSPVTPPPPTTVQDWDWDLPPAVGLPASDAGAEEALPADSRDSSLTLRERRIALEEDVAALRKTLSQEGNIHRALERALRRAAGILPRLPPYVPLETRELLAEVALLEEEVTHLEDHVVFLREDLYKEALLFSSATQRLPGAKGKPPKRREGPRSAASESEQESASSAVAPVDVEQEELQTRILAAPGRQEGDVAVPEVLQQDAGPEVRQQDSGPEDRQQDGVVPSQAEEQPGSSGVSAPDVKQEPDLEVVTDQSTKEVCSQSDVELCDVDVADVKRGPRKDSVVARLLQTGGKPQAAGTARPQPVRAAAKSDAGSSKTQKRQPRRTAEGSAGNKTSQKPSGEGKVVTTAKYASSRHQSSGQVSQKVTPRPLPCPPTAASTIKGSQSVVKPQNRLAEPKAQRSRDSRVEKENRGAAPAKNLKQLPQTATSKVQPSSGSQKVSVASAGTPSATPAATPKVSPSATPSVTPAATPSVTPAATPSATPAATPSASPAGSPKLVPLSGAATPKFQPLSSAYLQDGVKSEANKLSEEMVNCLMDIYCKLAGISSVSDVDASSVMSRSTYASSSSSRSLGSPGDSAGFSAFPGDMETDPYGVICEGRARDIGSYADFREITAASFDHSRVPASAALYRRHRVLLKKLSVVNLRGLTHQQKLAFWINTYNVCMMHAFLEHGVPSSPHKTFALMRKAAVNVGGYLLNPLTIEHFILRLPSQSRQANTDNLNSGNDASQQSAYALQWPEPLVTFALSCGSRSSPAVRVYTPADVDAELEAAKRDYLEAAVGITIDNKIVIPKLLEWYLRDFAKDAHSLMEWICEQLPPPLQEAAQECVERVETDDLPHHIEVMPYDFDFRYLFAC